MYFFSSRLESPTSEELNLYSFTFDDFSLSADEMLMASIRMFKDSGFIEAFHIDYEVWLMVHPGYKHCTLRHTCIVFI